MAIHEHIGEEGLADRETAVQAQSLKTELGIAYDALKAAASNFGTVQGRVDKFLEENEVVPPPPEGLDEEVNNLYQLWSRTPDVSEIERVLRVRLTN